MKLLSCEASYQTDRISPKLVLLKECFRFPWELTEVNFVSHNYYTLKIAEYNPKYLSIAHKAFPDFFF